MLDKNLKTARQITIHAKIAGPILKLSKIFLLHYLADSYYTEIKKESSIDRFMCAYSYEFYLPTSIFFLIQIYLLCIPSFTFSASLQKL